MKVIPSKIDDVLIIEPTIHSDKRGYFFESFNQKILNKFLNKPFTPIQNNQSYSKKGTLRGIHYQKNPMAQAKLVRVVEGEIFDVAIDLRKKSPTFCKWVGKYLSSENKNQLFIPEGFGHAFLVISEFASVLYKVNNFYSKENEMTIRYNDPKFSIRWPLDNFNHSKKDSNADFIDDSSNLF